MVFTVSRGLQTRLGWRIPKFTDAVALGKDRIIIREDKFTAVFRFDGTPVCSANLPQWEEGVIIGDRIVLSQSQSKTRALWVVEKETLDLLWSCHNEPRGFVIR